jgi:NAD(P)-dependent dehydrogenase (short-subunit alcohol dehydrogenase family)
MQAVLDGRVALVTGAGRGIGREIAIGLANAGARVALVSRTHTELDEVGKTITENGGEAIAVVSNVGDADSARAAVNETVARLGPLDVLINNAAVVAPLGPTESLRPKDVYTALAVNVGAITTLCGLVIPGMRASGWGRIVNVSSGIAEHPAAMIGGNVYAATKAALEASTINLAAELEGTGITVNAYRPGAVDTAMQAWIRNQSPDEIGHALHERFVATHASGDLISPETSAARLLERLRSPATGQIWNVSDSANPATAAAR